jgi:hypothetical protein
MADSREKVQVLYKVNVGFNIPCRYMRISLTRNHKHTKETLYICNVLHNNHKKAINDVINLAYYLCSVTN